MSPRPLEFMFNGLEVGYFIEDQYPMRNGEYEYEAYRGPGHYELVTTLRVKQVAECYYDEGSERIFFTVQVGRSTTKKILHLAGFRRV